MPPLRASEINTYLYCQRAWWYQRTGAESQNLAKMAAGTQLHYRHSKTVLRAHMVRLLGYLLLLGALLLTAIYLTAQWFS